MTNPPADWYPDPTGRYDYRYWDGEQWTGHVSTAGSTEWDPLPESAPSDSAATAAADDGDAPPTGAAGRDGGGPPPGQEAVTGTMPGDGTAAAAQTTSAAATTASAGTGPAATVRAGIRSDLLEVGLRDLGGGRVALPSPHVLRVTLGEDVLARPGTMVASRGEISFDHEGPGSAGTALERTVTDEAVPLMRCTGEGELLLAHGGDTVHLVHLAGGAVSVNGRNLLAFEPTLEWDADRVGDATVVGEGRVDTVLLRGTGWVAVTTHGTPVTIEADQPVHAHVHAAVAWSAGLQVGVHRDRTGDGSSEAARLAFTGEGFVVLQAPGDALERPHDHGG